MSSCQSSATTATNNNMSRGCCPAGSWGHLAPDSEYHEKGQVDTLDTGLQVYRVGQATGGRCVVWNYDIYGFNGGRTRQLCDWIAEKGFLVLMPDFFRGDPIKPEDPTIISFVKEKSQWDDLKKDWEGAIVPYANKHGATVFGVIGTCWGTYSVLRQSAYPFVKAGVSMHPGHTLLSTFISVSEEDLLREVKCNQLFLPAQNDDANTKAGGLGDKILNGDGKHLLEIVEFPEMDHGWTTRGDLTDEKIKKDVVKAITLAIEFFEKHVK